MVYDKQATSNGQPALKANTPRLGAGRGTFSPKLASSPAPGTPTTVRKGPNNRGPSTPTDQTKDDVPTPVKAFLSSNITPRSGSRKARVDSASVTPNGTPDGTPKAKRPVSMVERWDDGISRGGSGSSALGISALDERWPLRAQSVVSEGARNSKMSSRPLSLQSGPSGRNAASPESSPMFFHADDAKPRLSSKPESQRPVLQTVFSGYTQYGGDDLEDNLSSSSTSPLTSETRPQFFRANSSAEAITPAMKLSARSAARKPPSQSASNAQPANGQRAASPLKDEVKSRNPPLCEGFNNMASSRRSSLSKPSSKDEPPSRKSSVSKPSPRRHTRLASSGTSTTAHEIGPPTTTAPPLSTTKRTTADLSRRSSLNLSSPSKTNHTKTSSVSGINYPPARRSSIALSDIPSRVSPMAPLQPSSSIRPLQSAPEDPPTVTPLQHQPTPPISPTHLTQPPGQSKLDHMNELAAKARRERKVLDLEISNSSLLAINRTLEREMRKQKEELRRLRRTPRRDVDGRVLSMGTNRTASSRVSDFSGMIGDEGEGDISSEADEDLLSNSFEDETRSLSSSTSSPPPDRSSFAKDTKRLDLDLSRHRSLLVDSQILNQALKRCLTTTESLILDGKRALDYQVDVSEIENTPSPKKKGGRVLEPTEDDDEIGHSGQGLLSPGVVSSGMSNPWDIRANDEDSLPLAEDIQANPESNPDGIGIATTSPLASPSPVPSHYHHVPYVPPDADLSPRSAAVLKTGWDAIKQDVKTPDGLRAAAPLGLSDYLQSLGWSPG